MYKYEFFEDVFVSGKELGDAVVKKGAGQEGGQ
jgi:hypothetical protein